MSKKRLFGNFISAFDFGRADRLQKFIFLKGNFKKMIANYEKT